MLAVNYKENGKISERITKLKLFIDKCNQEGKNYPSEKDDWKKTERSNLTIALNVLHAKIT